MGEESTVAWEKWVNVGPTGGQPDDGLGEQVPGRGKKINERGHASGLEHSVEAGGGAGSQEKTRCFSRCTEELWRGPQAAGYQSLLLGERRNQGWGRKGASSLYGVCGAPGLDELTHLGREERKNIKQASPFVLWPFHNL